MWLALLRQRLLPEEAEDGLAALVRLRQDGGAGLLQDLEAGHLAGQRGDVGVADAALAGGQVLNANAEAGNGVLAAGSAMRRGYRGRCSAS